MTQQKTTQDISNCLSAPFDPVENQPTGNWSLCYNPNKNELTLSVNMTPTLALVDGTQLTSTIDSDGLKDMVQFLCQVNLTMQSQSAGKK